MTCRPSVEVCRVEIEIAAPAAAVFDLVAHADRLATVVPQIAEVEIETEIETEVEMEVEMEVETKVETTVEMEAEPGAEGEVGVEVEVEPPPGPGRGSGPDGTPLSGRPGWGVGTRYRERRAQGRRIVTSEVEVVAYRPPEAIGLVADEGDSRWETEITTGTGSGPDTTVVTVVVGATGRTRTARLLNRLGRRLLARSITADLAAVADHLEAGSNPAGRPVADGRGAGDE